jgi:hypothetical protein
LYAAKREKEDQAQIIFLGILGCETRERAKPIRSNEIYFDNPVEERLVIWRRMNREKERAEIRATFISSAAVCY